jgi:tetratricopeptide (TPR) repeat protein
VEQLGEESLTAAVRAVELDPQQAEAWNTMGLVKHQLGEVAAAIDFFERALKLNEANMDFQSNYAAALHAADRLSEAEVWYRKVLAQDPSRPKTCNNYGVLIRELGDPQRSIELYHRAIERDPSYADAHWNLALALLATQQYESAWEEYEWRWTRSDCNERKPAHPFKELSPSDPWQGKKLFVYAEQGLGDTLQFVRMLRPLCDHAQVYLAPQKALLPLLSNLEWPNFHLLSLDAVPADMDYAFALMSLPYLFPQFAQLPSYHGPYLRAREDRVQKTAQVFEAQRLNVGLVWQGSRNKIDKGRSMPLASLVPLTRVEGTRFYSLQRNEGTEQLKPPPEGIRMRVFDDPYDADGAFLDTAAVIHHLDLVITTDTAMAHLVGAMGKEVWIMLQHVPDWRWGLSEPTTPWYPTARLYRQTRPGDWAGVVARVQQDLEHRVASKRRPSA